MSTGKEPRAPALTGADIVIKCLEAEGVEYVFGYPGGAVLYIYDALFKQDKIKHVLVRHEQGATHAADGYSRASKKVGVALVTSGPGLTNAVTGIATAYLDSIPMVIISGQVPTHAIGLDAFQEVDAIGITRPCVKHNFLVKRVEDIAPTIKKAFHLARTGRPGPVLVDIPKDITTMVHPFHYPEKVEMRSYNPVVKGHPGQIKKAAQLILEAKRPYVYAGGGVILSDAAAELTKLVKLLGYPCTNTLMGLGAFPATDRQFVGMLGMHGTYEANMTMQHCDVLIAVGARFDDRVIGNPAHFGQVPRKIIHIDIDPSSISKRVKVDVPIVGDVKETLQELLAHIEGHTDKIDKKALEAWWAQIELWRAKNCLRYDRSSEIIKPQFVIEKLYEVTKGDAFICSDVGQHQMWAAQFYKFNKPRSWISSGGLGTMGFGLPSAIGAQIGNPDRLVVSINGDGGIQMCAQELAVCAIHNIPVKVAIINNQVLGMVRQWQEIIYDERYSHIDLAGSPDFVKLAEAYGVKGFRATNKEEARRAWEAALAHPGPAVVDFVVPKLENVYPMVTQGRTIDEMILGDEE